MDNIASLTYNVTKMNRKTFDIPLDVNTSGDTGNVQNLTTFCQADYVPSVEEYFTGNIIKPTFTLC